MKKIIFLFIMIIFFCPSVYAASQSISSKVEAIPNFGGGTYYATQPASVPVPLYQSIGTRYTGTLSKVEFYLDNTKWNWNYNTTYTITLNMATEDWRNNFMGPIVVQTNSNGTTQSSSCSKYVSNTFRFVSYKTIKFNFKLCSTMGSYTKFTVYSSNTQNTAITGVSNYNLSSIVISDVSAAPTPTPVGPTPSPTPTPQPGNQDIINNANQNTQDIIDNNTQNTQDIIDNNTQNTSDIIENANQNTEIIQETLQDGLQNCTESRNMFSFPDYTDQIGNGLIWKVSNGVLTINGTASSSGRLVLIPLLNEITLDSSKTYSVSINKSGTVSNAPDVQLRSSSGNINSTSSLYYPITLSNNNGTIVGFALYIASGTVFTNYQLKPQLEVGSSPTTFAPYGSKSCTSKIDETTNAINNLNDSMNNGNIDDKTGFFTNFTDNTHGLTGIITLPLSTIQSLTNTSCVALSIPIPFTNSNVSLPCMTEVYQNYIPTVYSLWQIISFGIIAYLICLDIFRMVKGFKDPNEDKVEVLDL